MMWKIILIIILLTSTSQRIFQTQFKFSLFGINKGWIYLDKMTIAPGSATMFIQTKTQGLPYGRDSQIFIQAIRQSKWQKQMNDRCNNPVKMPLAVHDIKLDGSITSSRIMFSIQDYQIVYFIMKDCQSRLINDYNNTNLSLHVKLHILNNNRQIGQQQDHWYIIPFIVGAGIILIHLYLKQYKHTSQIDWSKILLFAGTVTQISSLCWKTFGYLIYLYSGSDHIFFHLIYLFLHSTSQSLVISLVTLIGFGWTLIYNYGQQFDIYLPIGINIIYLVGSLGIINIIITLVTKIGHSHDRHHIFDNVGGNILIGFRFLIIGIFIIGCILTYKKMRYSLKKFLIKFMILGILYISSTPIIVLTANYVIDAKNRHQFVFITVQIIKFITNLTLSYEFNIKNSQYNRINYKNSSFLPQEQTGFK